jgi:hypothetical protein
VPILRLGLNGLPWVTMGVNASSGGPGAASLTFD